MTIAKNVSAQSESSAYTTGKPANAIKNPATAGPTTEPIWNALAFHVTAFPNAWDGTRLGINAPRAAQPNARDDAERKINANITATPGSNWNWPLFSNNDAIAASVRSMKTSGGSGGMYECLKATTASPSEAKADSICVESRMRRREKRSA